jgi:hypothetical protein
LLCLPIRQADFGKFKLSEVDKRIRSGGASDENNIEDKEQA